MVTDWFRGLALGARFSLGRGAAAPAQEGPENRTVNREDSIRDPRDLRQDRRPERREGNRRS